MFIHFLHSGQFCCHSNVRGSQHPESKAKDVIWRSTAKALAVSLAEDPHTLSGRLLPLQLPSLASGTTAAPHVLLEQLQIFLQDMMAEEVLTTEEIKRVHRPTKATLPLLTAESQPPRTPQAGSISLPPTVLTCQQEPSSTGFITPILISQQGKHQWLELWFLGTWGFCSAGEICNGWSSTTQHFASPP